MPRIPRIIIPGLAYHVCQRGNGRQTTFFGDEDYRLYLKLLAKWARLADLEILAYCLMPNHIHLICIPWVREALARAIGNVHQRYTTVINRRLERTGHLWQGRFYSTPMDDTHFYVAVRYVEQNPVRAGLVAKPWDWPWSSTQAHLLGQPDGVVEPAALLRRWPDWNELLLDAPTDQELDLMRRHVESGFPLGSPLFLKQLEGALGRRLQPGRPGRPIGSLSRRSQGVVREAGAPNFSPGPGVESTLVPVLPCN